MANIPGKPVKPQVPALEPAGVYLNPVTKRRAEELQRLGNRLEFLARRNVGLLGSSFFRVSGLGGRLAMRAAGGMSAGARIQALPLHANRGADLADQYRDEQGDAERAARQAAAQDAQQEAAARAAKWRGWMDAAAAAALSASNAWIDSAGIVTGLVNGPTLMTPPGALQGWGSLADPIVEALCAAGMPWNAARVFGDGVETAWLNWSCGWVVWKTDAFPSFAVVVSPLAPPTRARPFPLSSGHSSGMAGLQEGRLAETLIGALQELATSVEAKGAIRVWFAQRFCRAFRRWQCAAQVQGVLGWGPVPSFAPPHSPCGPVVGGCACGLEVLRNSRLVL